jgi:hypothetical protein
MRPRTILAVAFLAGATLVPRCAARRTVTVPSRIPPVPSVSSAVRDLVPPPVELQRASDPFRATIRPILSEHCGACHDPGGKMYARLPFDDPRVVASHSEGVLRRLKGDDREALQRWFAGLAPAATQR